LQKQRFFIQHTSLPFLLENVVAPAILRNHQLMLKGQTNAAFDFRMSRVQKNSQQMLILFF